MALALFDFDGTITNQDTFTQFVFHSTSKRRLFIGYVLLFPAIILYKLGLLPAARIRPLISKAAFWRRSPESISILAKEFVEHYLPTVIKTDAIERLNWHKAHGDEIYVVSASLSCYLELWCRKNGYKVLCSELEVVNAKFTGRYVNGDCSGERKVASIHRELDLTKFERIFAYGDTEEDRAMLNLAHERYYQGTWMSNECRQSKSA